MTPDPWAVYPSCVDLVLAMSPSGKCAAVLLFTGVVAPIVGILFRRVSAGWDSVGKGPFAIEQQLPQVPRHFSGPTAAVDPPIQAAEVRQMLEAKQERRQRRGESPIDIEVETKRLLAAPDPAAGAEQDAELRAEIRQLVVSRNERRMRQGQLPLDVETEIERQLQDLVGSS
ncbi:MAG: hypothetical protein JWM24_945 [Solirubrobacterales bacterium]|nr:hypothetical protein [Solirubrobacterales bacterium]